MPARAPAALGAVPESSGGPGGAAAGCRADRGGSGRSGAVQGDLAADRGGFPRLSADSGEVPEQVMGRSVLRVTGPGAVAGTPPGLVVPVRARAVPRCVRAAVVILAAAAGTPPGPAAVSPLLLPADRPGLRRRTIRAGFAVRCTAASGPRLSGPAAALPGTGAGSGCGLSASGSTPTRPTGHGAAGGPRGAAGPPGSPWQPGAPAGSGPGCSAGSAAGGWPRWATGGTSGLP